jgi:hypothetical protein
LTNEQWFDCFGQDKKHESKALDISEKNRKDIGKDISEKNRKDIGKPKPSKNRKVFIMG